MNSNHIAIVSHSNPDGDAIGSILGLYKILDKLGKKVTPIVPNDFPKFLKWIDGAEKIKIFEKHTNQAKEILMVADLIVCLDFNSLERAGEDMHTIINRSTANKMLIDHHLEPESFADFSYSKIETSSTAELVFDLISNAGYDKYLDIGAAEALYVGIMTDTGSFSYACGYPETFITISKLIEIGINPERINQKVYHTNSEDRLRLLGYSINEKLVVLKDFSTAYIFLARKDLKKFKFRSGDTEGVVNYALSIEGINLAAIFIEKQGLTKISFRSKGAFSVNEFARKYFNGGGHNNAAGGNSDLSLEKTIKKFEELLPSHKNEIESSLL